MKKIIVCFFIGIILFSIKTTNDPNIEIPIKENEIGKITIPKIHLEQPLYSINSEENTIEKNVTILKESTMPDKNDSLLILAAHSGTGKIAYFDELDQLIIGDQIIIHYQTKEYQYIVKEIWEEKKNGYINLNKEKTKQLVLTTCSPNKQNTQLIINCIIKES